MSGKKLMQLASEVKVAANIKLQKGIIAALAFFDLYDLPQRKRRIYELLYKVLASESEVYEELDKMVKAGMLVNAGERYGLKDWDQRRLDSNREEIEKRWRKIKRYFWILSLIPFIRHIAVIHSLAIGNADQESDIDFFVVTKPNRLYFVRSLIIVIFKLLGVYKTRTNIRERFCFGYYITTAKMDLSELEGKDDFLAFWYASQIPILVGDVQDGYIAANSWIKEYFPNFDPTFRHNHLLKPKSLHLAIKKILEAILWLPAALAEPLLQSIHYRHTFSLPENHLPTSTTTVNEYMLKLQALGARQEINRKFNQKLDRLP